MPNLKGNPEWKPKYGEPTKVVRLPESLAEQVTALLKRGATTTKVLQQLVSVPLLHRSQLPEIAAIYLVYQGDRLLYIGRTQSLKQRWVQHHRQRQFAELEDVRIAWFPCTENLPELEATLIDLLEPEFNWTEESLLESGSSRTQINFRLDNSLLAAIKTKCDEQGITQTDFITNAIKAALGIPTHEEDAVSADLLEELRMQLAETERRLSERIAQLEDQQLGGAVA